MRADRRLVMPLFAVVAMGLYFFFSPRLPKDQTIEIVLGDAAAKVVAVRLTYEDPGSSWTSEIELNYPKKSAPRVVHHAPHMPDGDYRLAIDVTGAAGGAHVDRRVVLRGGTTSVDVSEALALALR